MQIREIRETTGRNTIQEPQYISDHAIYLFEKPFTEHTLRTRFDGLGEKKVEALLRNHASRSPERLYFREAIFTFPEENKGMNEEVSFSPLELVISSSYHFQAMMGGRCDSFNQMSRLAVGGTVITSDEHPQVVLGLRAGRVEPDTIDVVPCAAAEYKPGFESPFDSFYLELFHKSGIEKGDLNYVMLTGYQVYGRNSVDLIFTGKTTHTFQDLVNIHSRAFSACESAGDQKNPDQKNLAIQQFGLNNIEAWQHRALISIYDDKKRIQDVIESRSIRYQNQEYGLLLVGRGILIGHINTKF